MPLLITDPAVRPLVALGLLCSSALLVGCAPDVPEGQDEAQPEPAAEGGWRVHIAGPEVDEDHPGSVLLTRRAEDGAAGGYRPRLVLGCDEGVTHAYVEWGTPLEVAEVRVTYRLDGGAPEVERWQVSADGEAVGRWHDSTSVPFIRALLGHDHLAVEAVRAGAGALTSAFGLSGLDSLLVPVQERCGWE